MLTASYVKNTEASDYGWTRNYTWYDIKGRVVGTHSVNHLGGYTKRESKLDFSGTPQTVVTKHKRLDTDTERVITETFTYDHQNRPLVHKHKVDSNPEEILVQNTYNELSQLESKKVGGIALGSALQTVDYKYNIRGWMTQINEPANLGTDLFGYKINYNHVEGLETPNSDFLDLKVKPKYNGNIAEVSWKTLTEENEPLKRYGYVYDPLNRLSAGFYQKAGNGSAKEYFEKLDYDLNGNITRLKRSGGVLPGSTVALGIDNLRYDYTGNRLTKVTDEQQNPSGYPYVVTPNTIEYDNGSISGNGNMTKNLDKGISSIEYNYLNLPKQISQNSKVTNYLYRADGVKLKKLFGDLETHYLDGFQYKSTFQIESWDGFGTYHPDPNEVPELKLRIIPTSEGYYDALLNKYVYNFTDHLGNVRLSYTDTNADGIIQPRSYNTSVCLPKIGCLGEWKPGEIVEVDNYYPFGLLHNYTATNQNVYQYKYNGKELQETGMYDYGARMYMPDLGRWGVVDPLAEQYRRFSTYSYTVNNPIRFIDPDGMQVMDPGDKFKNLRSAAIDFGKQYNGLSINYNAEVSTLFYKAVDKSGEVYYSYSIPEMGSQGMTSGITPDQVAEVSKLGEIVGDGHTHAGDMDVIKMDGKDYSSANQFSGRDVNSYKNTLFDSNGKKEDNGLGKPVTGYVATPDGGLREFIPGVSNNSNSAKKDAAGIPVKNYDIPVDSSLPSDPSSKSLRLNNIAPTNMPNVLPNGFDPEQPKRY
ncbi:RHS repeat-associated core domain-containing protein [Chryseobacterium phocaeense]|uniref:RHS repeat-associated core domain-containing protein n=1 Tax=Chryseobacterium phocaeense TaxID=1816690 RepID=UPI0009BAF7BC|nr:RHS repeat-associated core domain-containing protein [Chryseobacterium phocaeense]